LAEEVSISVVVKPSNMALPSARVVIGA